MMSSVPQDWRSYLSTARLTVRDAAPDDPAGAALATPQDRARFWQAVWERPTMADAICADVLARNERRRAEGGE